MPTLTIELTMGQIPGCQWPWSNFLTIDHAAKSRVSVAMVSALPPPPPELGSASLLYVLYSTMKPAVNYWGPLLVKT